MLENAAGTEINGLLDPATNSARGTKSLMAIVYLWRDLAAFVGVGWMEAPAVTAADFLASFLAFPLSLLDPPPSFASPPIAFAFESRSAGYPQALAVEASHEATALVSSLYCWYMLTRGPGSILTLELLWTAVGVGSIRVLLLVCSVVKLGGVSMIPCLKEV